MNRKLIWILALGYCMSCNDSKPKEEVAKPTNETPPPVVTPLENPGEQIIAANDCLTCHKVDTKLVGPAYQEVAAKYAENPDAIKILSESIIKGSKGKFGDVPMTPHPTMSNEDAQKAVEYILTLKK